MNFFRIRDHWLLPLAVIASGLFSRNAHAQEGFALNRFEPSERGSDWFWAESLDLRGSNRWAIGVVGDWAHRPLVAYDSERRATSALVENQLYAHLGASVVLWERLRLAASVPILAYQNGEDVSVGGVDYAAPSGAAFGDVRLGADVRIFGRYGSAATLALGAQAHLPTGSRGAYTGDSSARIVPKASFAGDAGIITYAVKTGLNVRLLEADFASLPFGTEWFFGGAVGLRLLEKKLTVGPEVWASTVLNDASRGFFQVGATPVEGILGAHYQFARDWRVGAGAGPGFTRGLGSPTFRALLSIEWFPAYEEQKPAAPTDSDGDGIIDAIDACPSIAGVKSSTPSENGCPPPRDSDRDGVLDEVDACPTVPGMSTSDTTKNGCPPPSDSDEDGVLDEVDACPTAPGVASSDASKNGCPAPKDSDKDGILDEVDACPTAPGVESSDAKKHGCPKAVVEDGRIMILDRIEFDTGHATIRPESTPILEALLKVLQDRPEIEKVQVEGHTDNRGAAWLNRKLSKDRAAAVVRWLVEHGIDKARLSSDGFGPDRPIDSNDTDSGRQNNRRVEFNIQSAGTVKK